MGLADAGTPLSHEDTMKWADHIRQHGLIQFINLYNKNKNIENKEFKWGDEIEYTIVKFDDEREKAQLSLRSIEILQDINRDGIVDKAGCWTPEYGAFMLEGTPNNPYEDLDFVNVEENMRKRRKEIQKILKSDEEIMCLTAFPRMGCPGFTHPYTEPAPNKSLTESIFFPDECIFPGHPRYRNTTKNIKGRRGEKPFYNIPIFRDTNTKFPVDDCYKTEKNALPDKIYLDTMGFGCGYSCLQVTFQAKDINEARILYDQLAPFCPIMMALTAACPFHRGFITDIDSRWNILCHTQDCRTREEKGLVPLQKNKFILKKSRHDSIDCYISEAGQKYNDQKVVYHKEDYTKLINKGVDEILAQHISHLFVRNSISMFEEKLYQDDEVETDHFENIQSTVWQNMRFKPPPPNSSIGWRVEFRPCDVQLTDFENAAVSCFLALLTRTILAYKLNFLIPISKLDENMQRAQNRNAVKEQTFWFRRDVFENKLCTTKRCNGTSKRCQLKSTNGTITEKENIENKNSKSIFQKESSKLLPVQKWKKSLSYKNGVQENEIETNKSLKDKSSVLDNCQGLVASKNVDDECVKMTVDEILNGKGEFLGIIPLMKSFLLHLNLDQKTTQRIKGYLRLISGRASGKTLTIASWMRKFAMNHPAYRGDSVVNDKINYDLLKTMQAIQNGKLECPELLGDKSNIL